MNKSTAVLAALLAFFVGVVGGFTVSPVKKGINIKITTAAAAMRIANAIANSPTENGNSPVNLQYG